MKKIALLLVIATLVAMLASCDMLFPTNGPGGDDNKTPVERELLFDKNFEIDKFPLKEITIYSRHVFIDATCSGNLIKKAYGNLYIIPVSENKCVYLVIRMAARRKWGQLWEGGPVALYEGGLCSVFPCGGGPTS